MSGLFEQTVYDENLYKEVEKNYRNGKSYNIVRWQWGYTQDHRAFKNVLLTTRCFTIQDFDREVWDLFANFAKEKGYHLTWGAFGLENRNPEKPTNVYYDGLIFYLVEKEYKECITNQNVSRFLSCMVHFGYHCPDFEIVEKNEDH